MNYLIQWGNHLGAISNSVMADDHKHWMLQLFLSSKDKLEIQVEDTLISCPCILVDMDVKHNFCTGDKAHFTLLLDPTDSLSRQIRQNFLKGNSYYILHHELAETLQRNFNILLENYNTYTASNLFRSIYDAFSITKEVHNYDERILKLFEIMNLCECGDEEHQLKHYARNLALSPSRLAHLFKEQTGIPLKSYIVLHKLQKAYSIIFQEGSITEAAMEAGFDTPAHLAYTNKKMTGMSASNIIKDSEFLKVIL